MRSLVLLSLGALPLVASAGDLGTANSFNAFVFGDYVNGKSVDTHGRLAVGGNLDTTQGLAINSHNIAGSAAIPYSVVVGGTTYLKGSNVNGNVFSNGNFTYQSPTLNGGVSSNGSVSFLGDGQVNGDVRYGTTYTSERQYIKDAHPGTQGSTPNPIDFAAEATGYKNLSSFLGGLADNGTTTLSGQLKLSATDATPSLYVFTVTASQLLSSNDFLLDVANKNATVVINVKDLGTSTFAQHSWSAFSGTDSRKVLYNFTGATKVDTRSNGIVGSILAPYADIVGEGGNIDGTIIAAAFHSKTEIHDFQFRGDLPTPQAVPEPASMAALGLGALAMLKQRRK